MAPAALRYPKGLRGDVLDRRSAQPKTVMQVCVQARLLPRGLRLGTSAASRAAEAPLLPGVVRPGTSATTRAASRHLRELRDSEG